MKASSVLVFVAVVGLILAFFYYLGGSPSVSSGLLLQVETDPAAQAASLRVVSLLNQIQSLQIDREFFNNPTYQTLVDNSVPVLPQNVGRVNPFAPVPGVPRPSGSGR